MNSLSRRTLLAGLIGAPVAGAVAATTTIVVGSTDINVAGLNQQQLAEILKQHREATVAEIVDGFRGRRYYVGKFRGYYHPVYDPREDGL